MTSRIHYTKPSITELEVGYATDAARNGWGEQLITVKPHLVGAGSSAIEAFTPAPRPAIAGKPAPAVGSIPRGRLWELRRVTSLPGLSVLS